MPKHLAYIDRDLSWLSFNDRVLMEAADEAVPLFERLNFLAIHSSNVDEFFRVRVALVQRVVQASRKKLNTRTGIASPDEVLKLILNEVARQQLVYSHILRDIVQQHLPQVGVHIYFEEPYRPVHLEAVEDIFYSQALSFVQPLVFHLSDKPTLLLENRSLYILVELEREGEEFIGLVNVPSDDIGRFHELPGEKQKHYTFLDDVLHHFASVLFPGFKVHATGAIKLNRDAELFLEDEFALETAEKIRRSLAKRDVGDPSRLLYDPALSAQTLEWLKVGLALDESDCIRGSRYHNLDDLMSLPAPEDPKLRYPAWPALRHPRMKGVASIFDAIDQGDLLFAFPYHRYDYVLRLFNEAAIDPTVTIISVTLYRIARVSHITNALIGAARNGKKVTVLMEAKARFDEANNLDWADRMAKAGVHIKYSREAIKVHSKIALITRHRADNTKRRYAFIGTGNFNEKSARIYGDFALLTTDPRLTAELADSFNFIFGQAAAPTLKHLLVARVNMAERFRELVRFEIDAAKAGHHAEITLKLNNVQDQGMMDLLYEAADAGVKLNLLIRGICCLVPGERLRIIRIVDRYLEHARIYRFHHGGQDLLFMGSADWMERNISRRIEVVIPVWNEAARSVLLKCLETQLHDNVKAVSVSPDLENVPLRGDGPPVRAQEAFYRYLEGLG